MNRGVVVSLNPRKTPCIANDRRTAGAPSDLNVKYCCAGVSIRESCINEKPHERSETHDLRNKYWPKGG